MPAALRLQGTGAALPVPMTSLADTAVDDYLTAGQASILDLHAANGPVALRRFSNVLKTMVGDRAPLVLVPDASHAPFPEQPEIVANENQGGSGSL